MLQQEDDDNSQSKGREERYLVQKGGKQRRLPKLLPSSNAVKGNGRGESQAHHLMVRDSMIVSLMDGTLGMVFRPSSPRLHYH